MAEEFEVRWEGELPGPPELAWDAITVHVGGWMWPVAYEPRLGGSERGLSDCGGAVTAWEPGRWFATRAETEHGANELDYRLEARGDHTYLRYTHRGVITGDYDLELDACRQHTDLYYHTLGVYLRHFAGRPAHYVTVDGPAESARGGFARLRSALGAGDGVNVGEPIRLMPAGLAPVAGVVDYATPSFLGVRTSDALYRFFGRDTWGWPVGMSVHAFDRPDGRDWNDWLTTLGTVA